MINYLKSKIVLLMFMFLTATLFANEHDCGCNKDDFAFVKGGGTYFFPNSVNGLLNERVTRFFISAKNNSIKKGKFFVSSQAAAPFDLINGFDVEWKGRVDAVRVFENHPDIVWLHGRVEGTIRFGTNPEYGVNAGQTVTLDSSNNEFIGAVSKWGRTDFLTLFENGGGPFPVFASATEEELTTLVKGFSGILLTNGAKPGRVDIRTSGNTFIISN